MSSKKDEAEEYLMEDSSSPSSSSQSQGLPTPVSAHQPPQSTSYSLHPAFYVTIWIALSSSVILFNKWILAHEERQFKFPIFLTTWHLIFATIATQIMARTTKLLDGRKTVRMTGKVYLRAIVPIGIFFSLSLICSNQAYLYLSVAFIQMLKATTPVAVLLASWALAVDKPNMKTLANVSFIVIGVIVASYGEINFVVIGFIFQAFGVAFEATRLVMVQRLLNAPEYKMDPLVSLYYFAPVCAFMNFVMFLIFEGRDISMSAIVNVGFFVLIANAAVAFALNVSVVFLIGKTSSLVLTLCGVLKDILLVVASIMIWGTIVTWLQMFGYSIALGGLVYYKLGGDKLRESYVQLRTNGARAWDEYGQKYPVWRKAAVAGGGFFFLLLIIGGVLFPRSGPETKAVNIQQEFTSPLENKLTSAVGDYVDTQKHTFDEGDTYIPKRDLDIVMAMHHENVDTVAKQLKELKELKAFSGLKPHVIIYVKDGKETLDKIKEKTGADEVLDLVNRGREGGTYLTHIINRFDDVAKHTLFVQAEPHDFSKIKRRLEDYFKPEKTGMLSVGFGHASCSCDHCEDPWGGRDIWTRVPEIFSAVYGELCPPSKILLSYAGQFVASAKRIRAGEKHTYQHLKEVLESDTDHWIHGDPRAGRFNDSPSAPFFGHSLERSWMIIMRCAEPRLADTCPRLSDVRAAGDADDKCQCLDLPE
ncbi:TPT-domain-containing protein [Ascobolus immersus RN42]|uniref:TPT-domain-containing protein n=1 Tax=Ascobolus immersus RN42 TaxID=1160509 RepID=A0A3N4I4Q1_ASCIM|nr:TPT-domain-containing protein [Ascobolus immersus RN42]